MFNPRPTIKDVLTALKTLAGIPRPDGDNEGDPINGDTVLPHLTPEHQDIVVSAAEIVYEYARTDDGQVNQRALNTLTNHGFQVSLNPSQYDQDRLVGSLAIDDWDIDISDPRNGSEEEED